MKNEPKADMIVDLQYGSTGKGLIAGYLANEGNYDTVVSANMPNAGHTYVRDDGIKFMHKVLPNGACSPYVKRVMIGPGAVFSLARLILEVNNMNAYGYNPSVFIHQNAVLLKSEHVSAESYASAIGSTQQGSGAAMIAKIERHTDIKTIVRDVISDEDLPANCSIVSPSFWAELLGQSKEILLEGAQGFSLGVNERFYPYCTSRDCTPARFMADMAIPLPYLRNVIGVARVHPIRVGGTSGGCYPDQEEVSWESLGLKDEFTTVTGRKRRVFTPSMEQLKDAIFQTRPDSVFLNFCNYDTGLAEDLMRGINWELAKHGDGKVAYTGWGPQHKHVHKVTYTREDNA